MRLTPVSWKRFSTHVMVHRAGTLRFWARLKRFHMAFLLILINILCFILFYKLYTQEFGRHESEKNGIKYDLGKASSSEREESFETVDTKTGAVSSIADMWDSWWSIRNIPSSNPGKSKPSKPVVNLIKPKPSTTKRTTKKPETMKRLSTKAIKDGTKLKQKSIKTTKKETKAPQKSIKATKKKETKLKQNSVTAKTKSKQPTEPQFDPNLPLLYPFAWNTNPEKCLKKPGRNILLIIIHTARGHFLERETIRKTWGSIQSYKTWDIKLVFIIGEKSSTEGANAEGKLKSEYKKFGDLTKSSFIDSYSNLTLKHGASYSWVLANCPNATLVLKTDDDFVIDIFKVINNKLGKRIDYANQGALWCRVYRKKSPIRAASSNWFVPNSLYSKKRYPDFCSGGAYITTVPTIRKLLNAAIGLRKPIPMDDVFFTGMAVKESNRIGALSSGNKTAAVTVKMIDISKQYVYYHWDRRGMKVIRNWYLNQVSKKSPWAFFLVQRTEMISTDASLVWKKICIVNSWKTNATE